MLTLKRIEELRRARTLLLDPEGRVKSVNIIRAEFDELLDAAEMATLLVTEPTDGQGLATTYQLESGRWHSEGRWWPKAPTFVAAVLAALGLKGESDAEKV